MYGSAYLCPANVYTMIVSPIIWPFFKSSREYNIDWFGSLALVAWSQGIEGRQRLINLNESFVLILGYFEKLIWRDLSKYLIWSVHSRNHVAAGSSLSHSNLILRNVVRGKKFGLKWETYDFPEGPIWGCSVQVEASNRPRCYGRF